MRHYDKSVLRLLDACKRTLCGNETKSLLLVYMKDKNKIQQLCKTFQGVVSDGYLVTRNEIATMMVEILQNENERNIIPKSKKTGVLFITDFEVISGKERSQKIVYETIRERFAEGKRTVVFTTRDVFGIGAYSHQMQTLFELADKFEI